MKLAGTSRDHELLFSNNAFFSLPHHDVIQQRVPVYILHANLARAHTKTAIMRNLPREIVAAIETAVEVNDGVLESAFIHSLAKIYKTSPQAIVWNMKRYNKVKAGCDDRKPGGHPVAITKTKRRNIYEK